MSKNAENIIAFMGVAGANADLACRRAEPYRETLPCGSFDGVFEAVLDGRAGLGMLPIENSQAGRVSEIHQILPQAGVSIVGEYFLPVQHCLAGPKGATLEGVKEVYSHPQALMQCRQSLKQRGLSAHAFANTAMAAQQVKAWGDPTKAALCSELAVELHGLELLQADMQDAAGNTTIFIKIAKEPLELEDIPKGSTILTSILVSLRNIPAALYKALGGFATNNVNLLKLESYVPGGDSHTAQFFITFVGHPEERSVQMALEELGFFTQRVDVLGSYPAAPERSQSGI
jgi:prephenate dehydratase